MTSELKIEVYTDGSCLKNPGGAGGWCYLFLEDESYVAVCAGEESTTNNRMEMQAVIKALKNIPNRHLHIYSDSQYVINCASGVWKRKKNLDLWKEYDKYVSSHRVSWTWVKGHAGNKYNEIVDDLAREEAKKCKN